MNNKALQKWLKSHDANAQVKCWVQIGDKELASPNMATILRDEIFEYQDKLDDIDYIEGGEENMRQLFALVDELLDELESRLQVNPELIEELESVQEKIDNGDTSDFVELELPEITFWDRVNSFAKATKIRDYVESGDALLTYVREKLPNLHSYIEGPYLFITQKDNASISTSIISCALDIEAKDINDSQWHNGIYCIKLEEQI